MPNVINKSNHPVEMKKISLSLWRLRDEIEAAVSERIGVEGSSEVNIEDIKNFYVNLTDQEISTESQNNGDERQDVDSAGNPIDSDAAEMMAALAGDGEDDSDEAANEEESDGKDNEDQPDAESNNEESDQKPENEESSQEDSEATEKSTDEQTSTFTRPTPSDEKITTGYLMLADINMESILTFTKGPFLQGQNIVIRFNIPKPFTCLATVTRCINIARNSKIISENKPTYRIHASFENKSGEEQEQLRAFLRSIEPEIPAPPKKIKKPDSDEDDDDFNDLGF